MIPSTPASRSRSARYRVRTVQTLTARPSARAVSTRSTAANGPAVTPSAPKNGVPRIMFHGGWIASQSYSRAIPSPSSTESQSRTASGTLGSSSRTAASAPS